jgi:hypothetical protein
MARPSGTPARDPRRSQRRTGHGEISSIIALDATVDAAPAPDVVWERVAAAWPDEAPMGPPPPVDAVPADGYDERMHLIANTPLRRGDALCRILVGPGRITALAHHSVLDGLGLIGVLSAAVDEPLGSTARGLGGAASPRGGVGYQVRRLLEAVARPPARIAPDRHEPPDGDHFVGGRMPPFSLDTADLIAATASSVADWNRRTVGRVGRVVVAVGASSAHADRATIGLNAAWLRFEVTDPSPEAIRRRLAAIAPEPRVSSRALDTAPGAALARSLSRRTGSTVLVSNLARLKPAGSVRSAAFYPQAHGRSGVSVGCVTTRDATVITLRARRSDYSLQAAVWLSRMIARRLGPLQARHRPES